MPTRAPRRPAAGAGRFPRAAAINALSTRAGHGAAGRRRRPTTPSGRRAAARRGRAVRRSRTAGGVAALAGLTGLALRHGGKLFDRLRGGGQRPDDTFTHEAQGPGTRDHARANGTAL